MVKLTKKDIFSIILCILVYILLVFASEFTGYLSPLLWVGVSVIASFLGSFPITYLMIRIQKPLVIIGTSAIWTLLLLISGEVWNPIVIIYPLSIGIIAEIVHKLLGYDTIIGLRVSYSLMSLVPFSQMLSLWTNTDSYVSMAVEEMGDDSYGAALNSYANMRTLVIIIVLTLIVGFTSTYIATAFLKEQLKKYGIK